MDVDRFKDSPIGRLVKVAGHDVRFDEDFEHWAFEPYPLPTTLALSTRTAKMVSEAMLALGRLDSATARLPNPGLVARPALRKEAVSTSALEGTHAAFREILEAEYVQEENRRPEVREVLNFVAAAEFGFEEVARRPLGRNLICQLHHLLLRGTRGGMMSPGRIREDLVVIGSEIGKVNEARFVPAPHGSLDEGLTAWERWIHHQDDIPFVARLALGHYQFETLHPFMDGNGRLGRLIVLLQLLEYGVVTAPVVNLSPWFERERVAYQDALAELSATGDYDPWIQFFSLALAEQATSSLQKVDRLIGLKTEMVEAVRSSAKRGAARDLAEMLIGYPVVSVGDLAVKLGVSYPTANNAVSVLENLGLLSQASSGNYNRIFACIPALEILES